MPDTPDLTPPKHQPMPEERRARVRAQLAGAALAKPPQPARHWLVPGLAAASVLAIVAAGAYVTMDSDPEPGSEQLLQPAGSSPTFPTQTIDPPTTAPTPIPTTAPRPIPSEVPNPDAVSCDEVVADLAQLEEPDLSGAMVTADRFYGLGTTYLYETKSDWVVCDDLTGASGISTLLSPYAKSQPYQPDISTLAISDNTTTSADGGPGIEEYVVNQYVAAGRDFDGVQAISYTFPDGHTEDAVVGQNGLWSMVYLPTDGVLADPKMNLGNLEPITVTVDYTGGETRDFTLQWGLDTCAQTNHGC